MPGNHPSSPRVLNDVKLADRRSAVPNERRTGVRFGLITGVIGLACCVTPVVLVLLGVLSAASAVALGEHLYGTWGWAFKLAAAGFAALFLLIQRRRARSCAADRRPDVRRIGLWLGGSAIVTYAALYVITTALGLAGR